MSLETIITNTEVSFKDFLFKNKRNRAILWIAAMAIVIQFSVFRYFYPFASYIHGDSFSYLHAANENLSINTYMVGYSNFLRLISVFTKSDTILVAFQYILVQGAALFFLFTLFYFHPASKVVQILLLSFTTLNPLFLHMANLVSSDCLFLAISFIWLTFLLWIIFQPSSNILICHAVVLFIAFTLRYNALIYPFISMAVIILSKQTAKRKIWGTVAGLLLCGWFVGFTTYKYKKLTGYWQYSPFSGWQWANNAMYAYRYVDSTERKPVAKKFQSLDNMIRQYFDSTKDTKRFPVENIMASTFYMWSPGMPLMKYRDSLFKKDTSAGELKKWASMGPFYKEYGIYIIKKYPLHFLRYFIWPNANKYYAPPIEFLDSYNSGKSTVTEQARKWFNYSSINVKTRMKSKETFILDFYTILSGVINVVMLIMLLYYLTLKGWKHRTTFRKIVLLGGTIWLLNAGFTIFASSPALRFQSFPILLTVISSLLLVDWLWAIAMNTKITNAKKDPNNLFKGELSV